MSVDKLLHLHPEKKLPSTDCTKALANAFAEFFHGKITKLSSDFNPFPDTNRCLSEFCDFKYVTVDELSTYVVASDVKSCVLDPIPASIMKECTDVLYPVITRIVNLSLEESVLPACLKDAVVSPLLNKSSLDHEVLLNYKPISNLPFVSKCCEKVVSSQVKVYLNDNNLTEPFQSGYKERHGTGSALIKVQNDILRAIDDDTEMCCAVASRSVCSL